ncbi:MAG: DUF2059 domain-containing protein [Victivallaceae bacterium]|nr:DUF2059 domain-containing protein [Victivallaceae bacterium]
MKKILTALTAAVFLLGGAASEQPDAAVNAAIEYMVARGTPETMERTLKAVFDSQLAGNPELLPYRDALLGYLRSCLSYEANRDELAAVYAANFTPAELAELTRFARTPLGRKLARVDAEVGAALSEATSRKLVDNQKDFERDLQRIIKEKTTETTP